MKISIIVDGNNKLGMGHVYQSMTLFGFLKDATMGNAGVEFLTKSDDKVVELLKSTHCKVKKFSNDELIFSELEIRRPDIVIFDKLDVSSSLAYEIKSKIGSKLVIFTNLTEANKFADITVMAGMGSDFKNIYSKDPQTGQVQFWGPKYWLLRKEFYSYKRKETRDNMNIEKIVMIFGGADQANLSTFVLEKLLLIDGIKEISIILGPSFEHHAELDAVLNSGNKYPIKINVLKNVSNVSEIMYKCDLVFTSPGLSFFESLLVGSPVLCFHQNDFQRNAWAGFIQTLDKTDIHSLEHMLNERKFIFPDDANIKNMEIGMGKDEILYEILNSNVSKVKF